MNQLVGFQSRPLAEGLSTQLAHEVLYACRKSRVTVHCHGAGGGW